MADILVESSFYMGTSEACVVDLTPPTFSGINFLDVESRGQIRAGWSAGTDANNPIRYEVYIQAATASGLFNTANIAGITDKLQLDIFTLPDGSFLQNGVTYYLGVRAVDAIGNRDANTVSLNVISTGVLTSVDVYESKAAWSNITGNQLKVTAWADKNGSIAKTPDAVMGSASFQVFDRNGTAVAGFSGSLPSPNAEGIYSFVPVSDTLPLDYHHELRITISVDGEGRTNIIAIPKPDEIYNIDGVVSLNNSNNIIGSFWVDNNGCVVSTGLGLASYQVYLADGTLVPGLTESGIVADVNGFYKITPFALPGAFDVTESYIASVSLEVDGQPKLKNIVIQDEPVVYDNFAGVSINAMNQLQVSMWATKNNEKIESGILGTASFTIYDKSGVAVAGMSQSGLVADSNGYFHSTPISAVLLTDLTHYLMELTIVVAGQARTSSIALGLLGT